MTCGTVTILTQLTNPIWSSFDLSSGKVDHDNQLTVLVTPQGIEKVEVFIKK